MNEKEINNFFPIPSQTSIIDKYILLKINKFINLNIKNFIYLEIGSYLGGSLTPFLINKNCKRVISVDKRHQILQDERSEKWSYKKYSNNLMIKKLKENKLNINKLKSFDGDMSEYKSNENYDIVFIDGIHTDKNTFSDFLYSFDRVKKNSIILFHDSTVIYKSLLLINELLSKNKCKYKIFKFKNSGITGIFFGSFSKMNINKRIFPTQNFLKFCNKVEENLLIQKLNNRIKIEFKISRFLKNKFPYKFKIKSEEKKLA